MKRIKQFARVLKKVTPVNPNTFTGFQVVPDIMSEHALTLMAETSVSSPVNDGVLGRFGMLPPTGLTSSGNPSTKGKDSLTGSAGSFMSINTFASSQYT